MNGPRFLRIRAAATALLCTGALIGCPGSDRGGRSCEGLSFDHPLESRWIDYEPGSLLVFSGPNATARYEVVSVEDLPPNDRIGPVGTTGDSLGCRLARRTTLREVGQELLLELSMEQSEFVDASPAEEPLYVQVIARSTRFDTTADLGFVVLDPGTRSSSPVGSGAAVRRDETVGDRSFDLVLVLDASGSVGSAYLGVPDRIESLSLAEGFGVVAIQRADVGPLYLEEVISGSPNR